MAARRLLAVMLVLLGISTLAAAFIPRQSLREGTTASVTEETESVPPDSLPRGDELIVTVEVGEDEIPVVSPVRVGDQLSLTVRCRCSKLLEIPALGRVEPVAPQTPAHFDLLMREPGSFGIRFAGGDRVVARIEVSPAKG